MFLLGIVEILYLIGCFWVHHSWCKDLHCNVKGFGK